MFGHNNWVSAELREEDDVVNLLAMDRLDMNYNLSPAEGLLTDLAFQLLLVTLGLVLIDDSKSPLF